MKYIDIKLGGEEVELKLGMREVDLLERRADKSMLELVQALLSMKISTFVDIVIVGLQSDRRLTPQQVYKLLDKDLAANPSYLMDTIPEVGKQLAQLAGLPMDEDEDEEKAPKGKPKAVTTGKE